jgi:hypothetical protein
MSIDDYITLGKLTIDSSGVGIVMNTKKITGLGAGTSANDALAYGQSSASLAGLTLTGNLAMGSNKITGVAAGTDDNDAVTRVQLNSVAAGLQVKESVKAATTAALAAYTYSAGVMTADANGAFPSQDGIAISLNDRILVKDESGGNAPYNGLYYLSQVGDGSNPWKLTRVADADTSAEVKTGLTVHVDQGTAHANQNWTLTTTAPITLDTTDLAFTLYSTLADLVGGNGIDKSSNTISVDLSTYPGLEFSGGKLQVKAGDGVALNGSTGALDVDLATNSGLQITSNKLELDPDGARGLAKDAVGAYVKVESDGAIVFDGSNGGLETNLETTNPTLQISTNKLGVKLDGARAITTGASGIGCNVDGTSVVISGNQLTAAAAANAPLLRRAIAVDEAIAAGDPVVWSNTTNNRIKKGAANSTIAGGTQWKARVIAVCEVAQGTVGNNATVVHHGKCPGVLSGATVSTPYYLQDAGGIGTGYASAENRHIQCGIAENATDLWVRILDYGRRPRAV